MCMHTVTINIVIVVSNMLSLLSKQLDSATGVAQGLGEGGFSHPALLKSPLPTNPVVMIYFEKKNGIRK